ncbi:MinD/ParA family ATP-binding protein [Parenemella sanctibonifatiensis]|uniref:ParA family protein n=1 Tax=Parenemella sanctibonifatiensis TaxID=2016505 RepID=A0A255EF25_9ACTN|nr:hypothetical protein [Parenemella sanctibonifatiensis]OYN89541.1 hypothetical protein CGZ91_11720 [Parenemella sanctibonifatiensis]
MALRTQGRSGTVRQFLQELHRFRPDTLSRGDVEAYTRKQPTGLFEAMVSARAGSDQLTAEEFRILQTILRRFYSVIVIDTANNEQAPAWQEAMRAASALIVPVKWKPDVVVPAVEMLEDLQKTAPELARRAVVVASHGVGEADPKYQLEGLNYLTPRAAKVVELPTDPHIAAGGPILWDQLTPAYRAGVQALGLAVAQTIPQPSLSPGLSQPPARMMPSAPAPLSPHPQPPQPAGPGYGAP